MNHFEFLTKPEVLKHVAICTALIIAFAFFFRIHPFKRKTRLALTASEDQNLWVAGDYYTFLRANIQTCSTFVELEGLREAVEGIFYKKFRVPITSADRSRYYTRLMEAVTQRENTLEGELMAGIHAN